MRFSWPLFWKRWRNQLQPQALWPHQAQLQLITDSVPGCIAYVDASQRYRFINRTYEDWFHCRQEAILGKTVAEVFGDAAYQQLRPQIEQVLAGERVTYEAEVPYRDDHVRYISAVLVPDWDEAQQVRGYYALVTDISEQKATEAALRRSETRFQQLAANLPGIIYTIVHAPDGSTWLEYISPAVEEILEVPPAQALADFSSISRLWHPADLESYNAALRHSLDAFEPFCHEWRVVTPSGCLKWLRAERSQMERRSNGDIVGYGIVLDVSDRKANENSLQRYERIVSATSDAIALIDRQYRFQIVNRVYLDWNNKTYGDIIGHTVYELRGQEKFETIVKPRLDRCFRGETVQYNEWFEFPTIGQQFLSVTYSPYVEADQTVSGAVVSIRNITSLKQAEEALRDSEERFRQAFQGAPIGMALLGLDACWLKVNPTLCHLLGYHESELLFTSLWTLIVPEDIDRVQHYLDQIRTSKLNDHHIKLRYCCSDGRLAWGLFSLSLVHNAENQPFYYVAQLQDITEQYAIDRMKNEFISIVSHELRTPLTAIRGFLGLLDTGIYDDKPEKAKRMLSQAMVNTERLVRLVNDILDLERLSSGKVPLVMELCDAEDLMERAIAELQPLADRAGVTLTLQSTTAQIWAASDAILQTLTNLLSNAIKFSPAAAEVVLAATQQGDRVQFSVQDQGRGVPADKLTAIFKRFQQVDVSDSRQKGGTGLGLAICENIVQQHGGTIWVESTLGQGSTFYFTVPAGAMQTP